MHADLHATLIKAYADIFQISCLGEVAVRYMR